MRLTLLAALLLAASPARSQVRVQLRSNLQFQTAATAISASVAAVWLVGSSALTLQVVPVLAAPVAVVSEAVVQTVAQPVSVQTGLAQLSSRLEEVQTTGGDVGAGLAQAFNGASAPADAVYARPPNDVVQARRALKKQLKRASAQLHRLTPAEADAVIREAQQLGLEVRAKASDLAVTDNHWVGGPHIHVAGIHVPVQPGYQPPV